MPADALVIPAWNPQIHDRKNIDDIKVSIKEFGYVDPIIVRKSDGMVIGGAGRLMALRELWAEGWAGVDSKAMPVIAIECDDNTAKKLSLALNKIQSQPDIFLLSQLFQTLIDGGETVDSLTVTGYAPFEIEDLLNVAKDIANHLPETVTEMTHPPTVEPVTEKDEGESLIVERRFKIPLMYATLVDEQLNRAMWLKTKKKTQKIGMALVTIAKVAAEASQEIWEKVIKELEGEMAQQD